MRRTSELAIRVLLAACLLSLFAGIVSGATDLDHDGIPDDVDNETVVVTSASLPAGTYAFQELVVTNNAVLTLESDTSLPGFKGVAISAGNLSIDPSSVLSADNRGYPAQTGPGYPQANYLGAGHGGRGGGSGTQLGGPIYDSALHPTEPGSGSQDHAGGGVITLAVTNTLVVDGRITAAGAGGLGGWGGGSGGSIAITAGRFEGAGTIAADGGAEPDGFGGGGGGRVAVSTGVPAFTGTLQAKGGSSNNGYNAGEDGTVEVTTIPTPPVTVPGGASTPTDMKGDGKYDDVNGNNRLDFADVVLYFNQMTWISANEPVSGFDYNGNGRIDFADVVWLFNHL